MSTRRRPLIAGNWKMNGLRADGGNLASDMSDLMKNETDAVFDLAVCPPFTLIAAVGDYAPPLRRASAVGVYRWYRDAGLIAGAVGGGLLADQLGFRSAFLVIGGLSVVSAVFVAIATVEPAGAPSVEARQQSHDGPPYREDTAL